VVAVIEQEERHRREEMSCPNATVSPAQDQISAAIASGDTAATIELLQADRSLIQACDRDGASPLHIAAQQCNAELVTWLLDGRANVHKKDQHRLTALDRAALAVDPRNHRAQTFPAVARLLLDRSAELTIRAAVALGNLARVEQSILAQPNLLREISGDGGLLTLAVKHSQLATAQLLLDLGADVDERILLEQLEEPAPSWGMPLWYAALADDFAMARLLLDRGADPNANVYASGWPLRNAWDHKDGRVKQLLLDHGAKMQPYMVAEIHDVAEARRLLSASPSEEIVSELAWSAADHGCPEIVELALPHLDWPSRDSRWHWVIIQPIRGAGSHSAQNEGHFQSMASLLRHGVDPNVSRFGQTALHFAAARQSGLSGADRARFASMLLDYGARLDLRDDLLKSTPLGWASRWGHRELVEVLIHRGARIQEPEAEPWATPIAWATKRNHEAIVALLRKEGADGRTHHKR
jgi:ankyrin repeat protein